MVARIGEERVQALEQNNGVRKWTHDELRGIRDHYRAALKALKQNA
ncbi:Bacteriophage Lambda NinG protein [Paracidovorax citrulli]|nr:Bacteriophage Lambda NinG protein [Paracidovorax citrulli]